MNRQKRAKLNVKFELDVDRRHCQTYKFVDASYPHPSLARDNILVLYITGRLSLFSFITQN